MKIGRLKKNVPLHSFSTRGPLAGLMVVLLTACAGDMQDLEQYVQDTRNRYAGSVEPLPQFVAYQSYTYGAANERDPFLSKVVEEIPVTDSDIGPDRDRRKEPLEYFPLDSLQMVGTLSNDAEYWGLIRDPDGRVHQVKPGQHAGENYGEILRITEDKITLLEIIPDGLGGWIEREGSLSTGEE